MHSPPPTHNVTQNERTHSQTHRGDSHTLHTRSRTVRTTHLQQGYPATPANRGPRMVSRNDTPTTGTITPLHGAPHSHIRSQSCTRNPVPLVPSPGPTNSLAPETPDPLRPPLQAAPPQPTDAPAQPGRTLKTAAHLVIPLARRPRVGQASEGAALFLRGPLGNVVRKQVDSDKMASGASISCWRINLGQADISALLSRSLPGVF